MSLDAASIGTAIATIGALGTAAFGLVDALKTLPGGGISNSGYPLIEGALQVLFGNQTRKTATGDVKRLFDTLHGNWVNGVALADQKAIAKSLIKLRLDADTAAAFAAATDVDPATLKSVGAKMTAGTSLDPKEMNVLGRFDLGLTAILDDGYQHADQKYRNNTKIAATVIATLLALVRGMAVVANPSAWDICEALLAGLIAAPLAPMTKDLASALAAGVKVAQAIRK
jgi:hypothetical protein